jgi:hypothetical protein
LQSRLKRLPGSRKPAGLKRMDLRLRRGKAGIWGQDTLACATNRGATIRDSKPMWRVYEIVLKGVSPSIAKSAPFFVHLFGII